MNEHMLNQEGAKALFFFSVRVYNKGTYGCISIEEGDMMKRFEYKCICIVGGGEKTSRILNEYGREGWELVAVTGMWHYLKREM